MDSNGLQKPEARRWCVGPVIAVAIALAPLVAGYAFVQAARNAPQENWLLHALSSPLSVKCGLIMWASTVVLVVVGSVLWRAGAAGRARRHLSGEDGSVMLEFVLCLPFILFIVLLLVQSSLLMGGSINVHHAAYLACRSAIVQIPRDGGEIEPPNVLEGRSVSGKYVRIRAAGVWGVLPIAYGGKDIDEEDARVLSDGFVEFFREYGVDHTGWGDGYLGRKLYYAMTKTYVYVVPPQSGLEYDQHEDIEVKLSHEFYMAVPFVARLFRALGEDDIRDLGFGESEYSMMIRARCTLTNEGVQSYVEEEMNEDPS